MNRIQSVSLGCESTVPAHAIRYRFHHDADDAGIGPVVKQVGLFNPMIGGFTSEDDRPAVIEITKRIARRYLEYIDSGSSAWSETLSMNSLPSWLYDAGAQGAEFEIRDAPAERQAVHTEGTPEVILEVAGFMNRGEEKQALELPSGAIAI